MWFRKIKCFIFGHEWFCWSLLPDKKSSWCAYCATKLSPYPKMRERKLWDYPGGGTPAPWKYNSASEAFKGK